MKPVVGGIYYATGIHWVVEEIASDTEVKVIAIVFHVPDTRENVTTYLPINLLKKPRMHSFADKNKFKNLIRNMRIGEVFVL